MAIKDYCRPQELIEATDFINRFPEATKILAGGTDLIIQMALKEAKPQYLLDLGEIDSLKETKHENGTISIGSMATFSQIQQDPIILQHASILAEAATSIGSPQIRSRATIGGNVVNAAPAADVLPALLVFESKMRLQSQAGTRDVDLKEILIGINKTSIKSSEILTEIIITLPEAEKDSYQSFKKIGRRKAMAIARLNLALIIIFNSDQKSIKEARLALGAVGTTAYRVPEVEGLLKGKILNDATILEATELIEEIVAQKLGTRSTAPYKKKIAKAAFKEALLDIKAAREEGGQR